MILKLFTIFIILNAFSPNCFLKRFKRSLIKIKTFGIPESRQTADLRHFWFDNTLQNYLFTIIQRFEFKCKMLSKMSNKYL